jgi:4'-phosphopantetheinyl transferase
MHRAPIIRTSSFDEQRIKNNPLTLSEDEVLISIAPVPPDKEVLETMWSQLSLDERERAYRFLVQGARDQFITGRAVLRQLLGACLKVDAAALTFGYAPGGKPLLASQPAAADLRFNISHSGSCVAVALTRKRDVGIDIERIHPLPDWEAITSRFFSAREQQLIQALRADDRLKQFFHIWTCKEACLKATGEGLSDDLSALEFTFPTNNNLHAVSRLGGRWGVQSFPMPPGYAGAVAFQV